MWTLKSPELIPVDFPPLVTFGNVFTRQECEEIVRIGTELFPRETAIIQGQLKEFTIRKGHVSWIKSNNPATHWIYTRLVDTIEAVNQGNWRFDLEAIQDLQFTIYDEPQDNYDVHIDMMTTTGSRAYRKLSFSVQLTDELAYEGCDLEVIAGPKAFLAPRTQGSVTFFPSVILHRVTAITSGQRHSLVGWVEGPRFR